MARNNRKKKIHNNTFYFSIFRYVIIIIVIVFFVFLLSRQLVFFLRAFSYFQIREIQTSLNFSPIVENKIAELKGRSIFDVDLKEIQKIVERDYLGANHIRVTRRLPDQIQIQIEKRSSVAQVVQGTYFALIDEQGFLIAKEPQAVSGLPIISGVSFSINEILTGNKIFSRPLGVALKILKSHGEISLLKQFDIHQVDVANLSKIILTLSPPVTVFLDRDFSMRTFHVLSMILENVRKELNDIDYIDLRFKEPVINKR